ncbi:hypothetical protein PanWU01x14_256370 [Parasponia andersonii]|uniref:Uncharacterized protein n=1 Tax=Parasponia andersonii TaxID=3476 RepID=A0A2P5BAE4_PARAD|nr:hypothetical protein PanWU01x14_256370 [Parasponia andersonii]
MSGRDLLIAYLWMTLKSLTWDFILLIWIAHSRVYRKSSNEDDEYGGFALGTRISFDVPDHVPYVCNECDKPNGNCGVGLRCLCHTKERKDR